MYAHTYLHTVVARRSSAACLPSQRALPCLRVRPCVRSCRYSAALPRIVKPHVLNPLFLFIVVASLLFVVMWCLCSFVFACSTPSFGSSDRRGPALAQCQAWPPCLPGAESGSSSSSSSSSSNDNNNINDNNPPGASWILAALPSRSREWKRHIYIYIYVYVYIYIYIYDIYIYIYIYNISLSIYI